MIPTERVSGVAADVDGTAPPPGLGRLALPSRIKLQEYALVGVVLALVVIGSILKPDTFPTVDNIRNMLTQASVVGVLAIGMTFVIATAGIDLSVGSLVALVSVLAAAGLRDGFPVWAVIPAMLAIGALVGLVNGAFVRLGLPAFVVTLAALTYLRGIAFVASDGYAVPIADEAFLWFGRGELGGIHVPIVLAVVVALAGYVILNKTRFGLYALAVGGREEAARAMGIDVGRIKLAVYAGVGLLAALGGIIATARLGNGSPNAGIMFELDVISATVLGGTSLFGGYATVAGSVAGALFINFVRNGLNLLGVNPFWVQVVTGVILLLAVLVNTVVNRRVAEWARLAGAEPEPGGPEDEA
jgi:ribose/xylose/arabinose/galactoside ABC-type transport system permease subunit